MTWHDPLPALSDSDVPTHDDLNKYLDNLNYIHTFNKDGYEEANDGSNITTTSTSWAAISANFQRTLTTSGELVLVYFSVTAQLAQFDVAVDGTRMGNNTTGEGSVGQTGSSYLHTHNFFTVLELDPGAHTFDLMWKAISGTATIFTRFRPRFHIRKLTL